MEIITIFIVAFIINGFVRLVAVNSTAKTIQVALSNWINQPAPPDRSFKFIYTDIQSWGSVEYSAKTIVSCKKERIIVESFDNSIFNLPIDQISKISSPYGITIWEEVGEHDLKEVGEQEQVCFDKIFNLGLKKFSAGEYKEAIQNWDEAVRLNDKSAELYYKRGLAYYNLGEYQRAIQDYNQAIYLNSKYAKPYKNRGDAYCQLKDYAKAVEDYNQAITINQNYTQASKNLADAQKKLDELSEKSRQILTRIAIIPPLGFVISSRHIFSVKAFDQNNQEMSIEQVAWHTNGGKIDKDGTFHAGQSSGRFIVTATVGSIKDEIYITLVEPKNLTTLVVIPSKIEIKAGDTKTFSVKGLDQHNREMFIGQVQWQTSGGSIDNNGTFKASSMPGSFTVTATIDTPFGTIKGQAFVTVIATIDATTVKTIKGQTSAITIKQLKVDEPYKHIIGLKDRVSQEEFSVGDKVYFCTRCQLGYHKDSWQYLNCKCHECQSFDKVEIYTLPNTFICKAINELSPSSSQKDIDLGGLLGTDGNGDSYSIREAINNSTDFPDQEGNGGFRFRYTEPQEWGSTEYYVRRIITVHNTDIEVENFDGSRLLLPIRLIGNILSPVGRVIWQSSIFLAHSIHQTLIQSNSKTNLDTHHPKDDQVLSNKGTISRDLERILQEGDRNSEVRDRKQDEEDSKLSNNENCDYKYSKDFDLSSRYISNNDFIYINRVRRLSRRNEEYVSFYVEEYLRYNCTYSEYTDYIRYVRDHCFEE